MTDFDKGLHKRDVNYVPLTPLDFIARASEVYGDRLSMRYIFGRCLCFTVMVGVFRGHLQHELGSIFVYENLMRNTY